jgi:hypothetical protein
MYETGDHDESMEGRIKLPIMENTATLSTINIPLLNVSNVHMQNFL